MYPFLFPSIWCFLCTPVEGVESHYRHCEPLCERWEVNSGPLEEQATLPTLELPQPHSCDSCCFSSSEKAQRDAVTVGWGQHCRTLQLEDDVGFSFCEQA